MGVCFSRFIGRDACRKTRRASYSSNAPELIQIGLDLGLGNISNSFRLGMGHAQAIIMRTLWQLPRDLVALVSPA